MARFRPSARLIDLSPNARTVDALTLSWGVESLQVEEYHSSEEMVWFAVETAVQHGLIDHGDIVLVLAGAPDRHSAAATDVLRIVQVA
jgi:pyruvate kinase